MDVKIEHAEPTSVAFVQVGGPYEQMPVAFQRLYTWVGANGLMPAGMPRAVYLTDPATTAESEALWEVQTDLAEAPEQAPADAKGAGVRSVGAGDYACATHRGPYESIAPTYTTLTQWIAENDYEVCGPAAEVYLSDPADVAPEDYLTEVRFPIRRI